MERKYLLIGVFAVIFTILFGTFGINIYKEKTTIPQKTIYMIKEAEDSFSQDTKNIAGFYSKYENASLEYYYKYKYCKEIFDSTIKNFENVFEIKSVNKLSNIDRTPLGSYGLPYDQFELPVLVVSGNAKVYDYSGNLLDEREQKTVISGIEACSEKILIHDLCVLLKNQEGLCKEISPADISVEEQKSNSNDPECYLPCSIKYNVGDILISSIWNGPPCSRIKSFTIGSLVRNRECDKNSCKSDENDKGCCTNEQCIFKGNCAVKSAVLDVNEDGSKEVCTETDEEYIWSNPDSSMQRCKESNFVWLGCENPKQCEHGINDYDDSKGLCCGDDKKEFATECEGKICNRQSDFACCPANHCSFEGKCYYSGCAAIETEVGIQNAYCNGPTNTWVDLDDDYCLLCLGNKASLGTICCGDDIGEGEYPTRFVINNPNGTSTTSLYGCAKEKSQCIYPQSDQIFEEGHYIFKENSPYLKGSYYCDNSQWFSLESNKKYCTKSGFFWDKKKQVCCGDSPKEFYISGKDGTYACCSSKDEEVLDGECQAEKACGNNKIDTGERCEFPGTDNSEYCAQPTKICQDVKTGIRDEKGLCTDSCQCKLDEFQYSCVAGSCGAQCGLDSDCGFGFGCDLSTCSCKERTFCGDGIVQNLNNYGQLEECEPPSSEKNIGCNIEECKNKRSKKAVSLIDIKVDGYGFCKDNCKCDYKGFNYSCQKSRCGAECNEDGTGCKEGYTCDTSSCTCYSLSVCGDEICEENELLSCSEDCTSANCPRGIDIDLDKGAYSVNDTLRLKVVAFDTDNAPIGNIKFDLDIVINDVLAGSSTYSTSSQGEYIISKKIGSYSPKGMHKYIAKIKMPGCLVISDTDYALIQVNNPFTDPLKDLNLSRYEFVIDFFNVTASSVPKSVCGDRVVSYGESCEGQGPCRVSSGCDYKKYLFDPEEYCSSCSCPEDIKSQASDDQYCRNCKHCGDDEINCGEDCENGTNNVGPICRNSRLYLQKDSCTSCKWKDDGITSDILLSNCECNCPANSEKNCINGNFINYTEDYRAGCQNGSCNACNCGDTYAKDSNNDGIEDKCSQEFCANRIDDNDNGKTDENGCIWQYCYQCGYGIFKLCTREDCARYAQGCFFNEYNKQGILGWFENKRGTCNKCSELKNCEGYGNDNQTCVDDPCTLRKCSFSNNECCTDMDSDNVCDSLDNCINISNPTQQDLDNDGVGAECEACDLEARLTKPQSVNETSCTDGVDNDCDGKADCKDSNCIGNGICCNNVLDCAQNHCMQENCIDNVCTFRKREVCDSSECKQGHFCNELGQCVDADFQMELCMNCANDTTLNDYGKIYSPLMSKISDALACCGDDPSEYYIEKLHGICCKAENDCVDSSGLCRSSNSTYSENRFICMDGLETECSQLNHCEKFGNYVCIYNTTYSFSKRLPKEVCRDNLDNDCDSKIDSEDEDC